MYNEIDEYLDEYDGQHAYDLIKKAIATNVDTNVGLNYRLAHACYILSNFRLFQEDDRVDLLKEAHAACKMAYQMEPKNAEVLKWSAIISGTLAELRVSSDDECITYAQEFKKYLDEAMSGAPDGSVYHMCGRFYYRMATLPSGKEKDQVIAAFGTIPTVTIDEAIANLYKAEELSPGHIENLLYLAKCYIAKGDEQEAKKYLAPILDMLPDDQTDEMNIAEAHKLFASIEQQDDKESADQDSLIDNLSDLETKSIESTDLLSSNSKENSDVDSSTIST